MGKYILPIVLIFVSIIALMIFRHYFYLCIFFIVFIGSNIGQIIGLYNNKGEKNLTLKHLGLVSIFAVVSVIISLLLLLYLKDKAFIAIILLNLVMLFLSIRYIYIKLKHGN